MAFHATPSLSNLHFSSLAVLTSCYRRGAEDDDSCLPTQRIRREATAMTLAVNFTLAEPALSWATNGARKTPLSDGGMKVRTDFTLVINVNKSGYRKVISKSVRALSTNDNVALTRVTVTLGMTHLVYLPPHSVSMLI